MEEELLIHSGAVWTSPKGRGGSAGPAQDPGSAEAQSTGSQAVLWPSAAAPDSQKAST